MNIKHNTLKTKQENLEAVRQFCLNSNQSALLFGGSGDGGITSGSGGGGTGKSEEAPPAWYAPDYTSSSRIIWPGL